MTTSSEKLERVSIGFLLSLALLMFFAPLVVTNGNLLVGEKSVPAYNLRAKLTRLQSDLERASAPASEGAATWASSGAATETPAGLQRLDLPFTLRNPWLPSSLIYAALAFAGLALLDLLLFRKATAILSFAGGCFGVLALLNVLTIGSDLGSWIETFLTSASLSSVTDPSASFRLLSANAFQLHPGPGLYSLTGSLLLAAFLSSTGAIPRISGVVRREKRIKLSQSMRIRPAHGHLPEETVTTLDCSRGGLSFESAASHYYAGMEVYVMRNAISGALATLEEHGSVVRVEELESGKRRVAVRIIFPV